MRLLDPLSLPPGCFSSQFTCFTRTCVQVGCSTRCRFRQVALLLSLLLLYSYMCTNAALLALQYKCCRFRQVALLLSLLLLYSYMCTNAALLALQYKCCRFRQVALLLSLLALLVHYMRANTDAKGARACWTRVRCDSSVYLLALLVHKYLLY
jgi:hypothetical protein